MASSAELKFISEWEKFTQLPLQSELKIIPKRRFRFDFGYLPSKVLIEINGGNWIRGRHVRPASINNEYEKYNLAVAHGYVVFTLSPEMITEQWLQIIVDTIYKRM